MIRFLSLVAAALVLVGAPATSAQTPCTDGSADGYACDGIDLMAHLPLSVFSTPGSGVPSGGNDVWGWADAASGREFALMGLRNGTGFVEVTDPAAPVFLGKLPSAGSSSTWRDIKTYADHAFIVSEASGHGMQVFDLRRLLTATGTGVTFTEDARYTGFGSAHNIVIDEGSALAVGVGSFSGACNSGGLHLVDISDPTSPTFAGCFNDDGYTHDAQCLVYDGPDTDYTGRSICVASNTDTVTIVDVTNPAAPVELARGFYPNPSYTHQGWFDESQRWFVVNDEIDGNNATPTRTIVMDLQDLDNPEFAFAQDGTTNARDHNLYLHDGLVFQSNYSAGLRVLDGSQIGSGSMPEVAFFDTYQPNDSYNSSGQWSNYPYLPSGTILASDINSGLFVVALAGGAQPAQAAVSGGPLTASLSGGETVTLPVTVANLAGADAQSLSYTASVRRPSGPAGATAARWVRVTPRAGSVAPGGSAEVSVTLSAAGVASGAYAATLLVRTNDPSAPSVTLPLSLTVGSGATAGGTSAELGGAVAGLAAAELSLSAPSPNPTRGSARVAFSLAEAGAARLSVVDALGREVAVLADGELSAGAHEATFDTARLPAGVYVVRLAAGGQVLVQNATVTR